MKKNIEALIDASKGVGREVNKEITKPRRTSERTAGVPTEIRTEHFPNMMQSRRNLHDRK
jgi:hypothetical protein